LGFGVAGQRAAGLAPAVPDGGDEPAARDTILESARTLVLARVYHVLGIDSKLGFKDHSGRPIPILDEGEPITEVI
jgi:hypothetical protein